MTGVGLKQGSERGRRGETSFLIGQERTRYFASTVQISQITGFARLKKFKTLGP